MRIRAIPAIKVSLFVVLAAALAGCAGSGTSAVNSYAQIGNSPTIAFESIDGPPPHVFERMVSLLDSESKSRNLSVVSREAPAAFRIRGYLSAQISRGRTTIAWVWDVYDRDGQRALRLSGEEAGTKSGRDGSRNAWSAADDGVLRRIALAGLTGLNGISSTSAPAEPQPVPPALRGSDPAIASADDAVHAAALSFSAY